MLECYSNEKGSSHFSSLKNEGECILYDSNKTIHSLTSLFWIFTFYLFQNTNASENNHNQNKQSETNLLSAEQELYQTMQDKVKTEKKTTPQQT